jgi:UMF1 family MFS transporter
MYDWANSAFATVVMAGFFPLFFKSYWHAGDPGSSTLYLGVANSLASLAIVVMAPLLGAIADQMGGRKKFLIMFAATGIVMTGLLPLAGAGHSLLAVFLYVLATFGFMGGNIFYDALLVDVSPPERRDQISSLGYGLGYLGGGILFAFCIALTRWPATFGLADSAAAVKTAFVLVAMWWAVFSLPLVLFVKERPAPATRPGSPLYHGIRQLRTTFRHLRQLRQTWLFLVAYWLYIDGVDTIVRMAVDYGLSIGLDSNSLITALLITQFIGFPAAIAFGALGTRIGSKNGIFLAIAVYVMVILWAYQMDSARDFYLLATIIGLVQGGIQALSRSLYSRLIPEDKSAEFFGFYNMLGKFAAVIGPLMVGWVSAVSGNARLSILSVIILFLLGAWILYYVDENKAKQSLPS